MKRLMLQHDEGTGEIRVQIQEHLVDELFETRVVFIMDRRFYVDSKALGQLAVIHQRSLDPDWREVCQ